MVIIQFSFLRGMILQDRKRLFFSEWKITNQSLEWLGYSCFFYLCVCCPPLIFAGASRRHLNLWCVSVMFIPHCLSDPTSSYAFFVDGISPEGFSCDPKSMIYIYIYSVDHVSHFLYFTQWDYPHRGKLSHMWKTRLWKMCVFYYYID